MKLTEIEIISRTLYNSISDSFINCSDIRLVRLNISFDSSIGLSYV